MTAPPDETAGDPARSDTRRWRPLAVLVLAQVVYGIGHGLAWLGWAPGTVAYVINLGAGGGGVLIPAESEAQVAGDGRFIVLAAVGGLIAGLVGWRLRALRGPLVPLVLALGATVSSVIAVGVGELLSGGSNHGPLNTAVSPPLTLHALPAVFAEAFVAVLVYTVLAGLNTDQELGRPPVAGAAPTAGPAAEPVSSSPAAEPS